MRIDAPSGSGAWQIGFFSGSFRGDLEGLTGSLEELSSSIGNISASINNTVHSVSSSIDEHLVQVSASLEEHIRVVSSSILNTVENISSSIHEDILQRSASLEEHILQQSSSLGNISASVDETIQRVSSSILDTIESLSGSFRSDLESISASLDENICELSGSVDLTIHSVSSSIIESMQTISESVDRSIHEVSSSLVDTVHSVSESIDLTILEVSASISGTIEDVSQSIHNDILDKSGSVAEDVRDIRTTYVPLRDFNEYTGSVVETYYRSGPNANLSGLTVSGSTLLKGDLIVSGTIIKVHAEDIVIKDKFIEIASGSQTPQEADGAGIGIVGANVTMSYSSVNDALTFNKPIIATITGSVQGTASYAKDVADDGIVARALVELHNAIHVVESSIIESSSIYLNCSSTRTYQDCKIQTLQQINLLLPDTLQNGIEHFMLFTNESDDACYIIPPEGILVPVQVASTIVDGGYADSDYAISGQFMCSAHKGLGLKYVVRNDSILFTDIITYH